MSTSQALRDVFAAGRPLVEQWLDIGEQIAALREAATAKGLDWSQVKALLKAQIQDERDESGDGKRVKRLVEKAEFASAYADMLGLANMNERKYFAGEEFDPSTGEIEHFGPPIVSAVVSAQAGRASEESPAPITPSAVATEAADTAGVFPPPETPATLSKPRHPKRPICLHPDACASYEPKHSHQCERALEAQGVAA